MHVVLFGLFKGIFNFKCYFLASNTSGMKLVERPEEGILEMSCS